MIEIEKEVSKAHRVSGTDIKERLTDIKESQGIERVARRANILAQRM